METDKFYHITPSVGGWKGEPEDSDVVVCEGASKEEVLDCIESHASKDEVCHIIIHSREGEPFEERLYNKGKRMDLEA